MQTEVELPAPQASAQDGFETTLRLALTLPAADLLRLGELLMRLGKAADLREGQDGAELIAVGTDALPPVTGDSHVKHWLEQIAFEPPIQRVRLIEDALGVAIEDDERRALEAARRELLDSSPALAARRAVEKLAATAPIAVAAGILGLAGAVYGLGRILFRVMF